MTHTEVIIHIDKKKHTSPNPTTGEALYTLGTIPTGYDLFLEVPGQGDDVLISRDGNSIEVKNGQHYYSVKQTLNPGNGN